MDRCIRWAAIAGSLTIAVTAWAQSQGTGGTVLPGEIGIVIELVKAGGLPFVLAYLAFQAGRNANGFALTVRLHPDDLAAFRDAACRGHDAE